jgi:hypothetical protein
MNENNKHILAEPFWAPPFSRIGRRAETIIPRSIKVVATDDDAVRSRVVVTCRVSRELIARMIATWMVLDASGVNEKKK